MKKIILLFLMVMIQSYSVLAQSAVVAMTENQVVMINLENNKTTILNQGDKFLKPLISESKSYVAYQDEKSNLCISSLVNNEEMLIKVEGVKDYIWHENQLIFSKNEGNVYQFNLETHEFSLFLERAGYVYDELKMNNQGVLFAKKYAIVPDYNWPIGIVEYDSKSLDESILIGYEPVTKTSIGFNPSIAKLSSDGKLIYIWCKPNSGSITADGVNLGMYDTSNDIFIKFNQITMLVYLDNLAINPISNDVVALIEGEGRVMNENKHLYFFKVKSQEMIPILSNEMTAMSPIFSFDGSKLYYSAGLEAPKEYKPFELGSNHLYVYDLTTKKSTQLTQSKKTFDFYPQEIENNELVFLQFVGKDKLNLVRRLADGKEVTLLENLNTNFQYYGHLEGNQILDVKK